MHIWAEQLLPRVTDVALGPQRCTSPDPADALRELRRLFGPAAGSTSSGTACHPSLTPPAGNTGSTKVQQRVAGGCNLDRQVEQIVADAGFAIQAMSVDQLRGPRLTGAWGHLFRGVAIKSSAS